MKIILAGASLNSGNRGVNALTRGQIKLIFDTFGFDTVITILSFTVNKIVENQFVYNGETKIIVEKPCLYKDSFKAYLLSLVGIKNSISNEIEDADYIFDISEGDSFSDIYGSRRFIRHSLIKLTALSMKKKLIIMPQTIGPFERWWVKILAKKIIKKADKVFVRDSISKSYIADTLRVKRDIHLIPDLAFNMPPVETINISKYLDGDHSIKVGINVSALLYNGGYTGNNMFKFKADYKKLIDELIIKFSNNKNTEVILIPHVMPENFEIEDDFKVCKKISQSMKSNFNLSIATVDRYYREDEIKGLIGGCDFFVGSRMHACIAGISTGVPTVPIAYSRKFKGVWDDLKLGFCITDPKMDDEDIGNKLWLVGIFDFLNHDLTSRAIKTSKFQAILHDFRPF